MASKPSYDVFISYRRSNEPKAAHATYFYLLLKGYRVFLDVVGLGSGYYEKQLYEILDQVNDLILILPEGALDRCVNEDGSANTSDWVYKEVSYALRKRKNVIPLLINCDVPKEEDLPEGLKSLPGLQSVSYSDDYFIERLGRLAAYLHSEPANANMKMREAYSENSQDFGMMRKPRPEEIRPPAAGGKANTFASDGAKPSSGEEIPAPPAEEEDLEPVVEVTPIPPTGRNWLGQPKYTKEDMNKVRADLRGRLEEQSDAIGRLMQEDWISSRSAYRSAKIAMILVEKLMEAYDWPYELETAKDKFKNQYRPGLASLGSYCREGEPWLSIDMIKVLRLYGSGLRELIQALQH